MKANDILVKFLIWRIKYLSDKNFVLILSGIIGIITGLAAILIKEVVHNLQQILTGNFNERVANYLYLAYPLIGILITLVIAKYLLKENLGHGITNIIYAISKKSSILKRTLLYSRMITSAITVSFGGSVGLEVPLIVTGSALGSNLGQLVHLSYRKRTLLIGCGAAAAISAIFNSPVAGVIFSVEVILTEVTIAAFIPLLIASVCGALVSITLLGENVLFAFTLTDTFEASDVPYYIALGVVCGLVSVYFSKINFQIEGRIKQIRNGFPRAIWGGIGLGLIIFVFPPIYGQGFETIKTLIAGREQDLLSNSLFFENIDSSIFILIFVLGIILFKPIAAALTVGAGGNGGIFGPSLFVGAATGFLTAKATNFVLGTQAMSTSNFTLVGMCGVLSGILHAPLTAIFLIAEITSGYTLFVPLMLVSAIAYSTSTYFEKHSVYTKMLIEQGDLIKYDKDRQVLSLIDMNKIIEKDLLTIHPDSKLDDLVELVRRSKRNIFPVVNENTELTGIVTLDDIRELMFDEEIRQNTKIESLMHAPPAFVSSTEKMQSVMLKFEKSGAWNLPVIDEGKYVGFVSKSRIFNAYRKKLIRQNRD